MENSETYLKSNIRSSKNPSITAISVTVGTIVLLFTYSLPGGLSGGQGFLLGTGISIVIQIFLAIVTSKDKPNNKLSCPNCGYKITITKDSNTNSNDF